MGSINPRWFFGVAASYLFGDGTYSGNIIQGGSVLQPQTYHAAGSDIAATGTPTYEGGSIYGGTMSLLWDGNNSSYFSINSDPANAFDWDFGAPVAMNKVVMSINAGSYNMYCKAQYADSAGAWVDASSATTVPLGASYTTIDLSSYGSHRYWRLRQTTQNYFQFTTVQWYTDIATQNAIVITGAATVAPDAVTGAAAFSCQNLVLDGASASLAPSTNCKGLVGFVAGSITLRNGAKLNTDKLGKAGNFGNLTVLDLVPQSIKRKLKPSLASFVVQGEGAGGGLGGNNASGGTSNAGAGATATALQTAGGGGGAGSNNAAGYPGAGGAGGKGGPCSGGAGGGGSGGPQGTPGYTGYPAGDYGGPGGNAQTCTGSWTSGGGAGDPVGLGSNTGQNGQGAGGGLLMLFSPSITIASGCVVSADGAKGGDGTGCCGGGGAGGGCVAAVTSPGGYQNSGTVRANGGIGGTGYNAWFNGGPGGVGSVNILTIS